MPPATLGELLALQLKFEQSTSKGGNRGFTCAHCDTHFIGSQTRQLAHLIGTKGKGIAICKKIPAEDRVALQEACGGIQNKPGTGPSSGSRPASSVEDPPRKRYKQQDLGPWLLTATKDELDDAVADFFYGTGTPLHISRHPLFTDMLKRVSLAKGGTYTGPTYKALREGLVARANGRIT